MMNKSNLPRFNVPPLKQTLDKYLVSIQPLCENGKEGKDYEWSKKLVHKFLEEGEGEKLQKLLEERKEKTESWINDWWLELAYLSIRDPSPINSNYSLVFGDYLNSSFPKEYDSKLIPKHLICSAFLIKEFYNFALKCYEDKLEHEKLPDGTLLCMKMFNKIFGTTRIPDEPIDTVGSTFSPTRSSHVIVIRRNHFYSITLEHPIKPLQIARTLLEIVQDASQKPRGFPLGAFSAWNRTKWSHARKNLSNLGNKHILEEIDTALICLCLDEREPLTLDEKVHVIFHGDVSESGNRWFDKTQLVMCENMSCGFNGEHSQVDGQPMIGMVKEVMTIVLGGIKQLFSQPPEKYKDQFSVTQSPGPYKTLNWILSPQLISDLQISYDDFRMRISDSDLRSVIWDSYGSTFIKKNAKVSPDAYVQMALQLSYYMLHSHFVAVYESSAIRNFHLGRTETMRSCTVESTSFVRSMFDPSIDNSTRYDLLRKACSTHIKMLKETQSGDGIDRHLLGLSYLAQKNNISRPNLFQDDPLFKKSKSWHLSTSQVTTPFFQGTFGAVEPDGYGIAYGIKHNFLLFSIESKRNSRKAHTNSFVNSLFQSLKIMSELCLSNSSKI